MKRETTSASEAPLELLNGAASHHKGLRHVELWQVRGQKGYTPVEGARWSLTNGEGEECAHDERPTTDAREIAIAVYAAAIETRRTHHDQRFQARFHCAEKDGTIRTAPPVKFEAVLAEGAAAPQTIAEAESAARIDMLSELRSYIGELHRALEDRDTKSSARMDNIADKFSTGLEKLVGVTVKSIEAIADVLPVIVGQRLDAAAHEVAAMQAIAESKGDGATSQWWKDQAKSVVDIIKSPPAIAVAAKAFGMDPDEILKLFGDQAAGKPSIRTLVQQLGTSLDATQQGKLRAGMASKLMKLQGVGTTTDDATAAKFCAEFFESLTKADWQLLAETLTDEQCNLVGQIAELAKAAKSAAK